MRKKLSRQRFYMLPADGKDSQITVIVPVYNVSLYIDECISSILNQDYPNFEIILINDGSEDNSLEKCIEWASKDNRIKYYTQENLGLSAARNKGVELTQTKYVSFVDPDDYIESDYISVLYNAIIGDDSDISIAYLDIVGKNEKLPTDISETITGNAALNMLCEGKIPVSACAKFYKTDLLRTTPFIEGLLYEDNPFSYQVLGKCSKVTICGEILYHHRIRKGSITQTISEKNFRDSIKASDLVLKCIEQYYSPSDYRCVERKIINWSSTEFLFHEYYSELLSEQECLQIENEQDRLRKNIIYSISQIDIADLAAKNRLKLCLIQFAPEWFYPLYKFYRTMKKAN